MKTIKNAVTLFILLLPLHPALAETVQVTEATSHNHTLWLVRHAEKATDDRKNPNLTESGTAQAKLLKDKLLNKNIEAIYATDYKRTQQTAAPLAKALSLEVQSYDPKKLTELAKSLKEKGQNALVVGHSNTTPELAWLLTGEHQFDIDEEEFNQVLIKVRNDIKTASSSLTAVNKEALSERTDVIKPAIAPQRIHSFSSHFNMLFNKEVIGSAAQKVDVSGEKITLSEHTVVKAFNIDATINAEVQRSDFSPLKMTMQGKMGVPADINITWSQNGNIHGHTNMARAKYKQQGRIDINEDFNTKSIERTAAIMLVPFFNDEKPFRFNWYNTYDAASRDVQYILLGEETVTVPAGTFETRKVKLQGGAPSQIFYISKEDKPKVVKIDVIKMPWTYELQSWQAK